MYYSLTLFLLLHANIDIFFKITVIIYNFLYTFACTFRQNLAGNNIVFCQDYCKKKTKNENIAVLIL